MIDVCMIARNGDRSIVKCVTQFGSRCEAIIEVSAVLDRLIESDPNTAKNLAAMFARACKTGKTIGGILEDAKVIKMESMPESELKRKMS